MLSCRRFATFSRSLNLLRSFRYEQRQPERFYGLLAQDTAELLAALCQDFHPAHGDTLAGAAVLDVGGGPGYFAEEFARRGAWYVGLEPDAGEMAAAGISLSHGVRGDGRALPFADHSFDVVYSSNVAEHIAQPWQMAEEMLRVTRPGGLTVLSYTVWLGPFGGHETGLWPHYLGGHYARRRYERRHGHPPKNIFGQSLFALSAREGLQWARLLSTGAAPPARVVLAFPRYHPWWAWPVVKVPVLREFLTSNLVLVLQPTGPDK